MNSVATYRTICGRIDHFAQIETQSDRLLVGPAFCLRGCHPGLFSTLKRTSGIVRFRCDRRGGCQSASVPWIVQTVGMVATPAALGFKTVVPFMNHIATSPPVSCQRMSLLPSPLKSPVSTIDHVVGTFPTPAALGFK